MRAMDPKIFELGKRSRAPVYIYDLARLRDRCSRLRNIAVAKKRVFFASMANDHPEVLSCARECGVGVFVNSLKHLRLARKLGFGPKQIVYASSNMQREEMETALHLGAHLVLDSIGQIKALARIAPRATEIGIRLNVGSALDRNEIKPDPAYRFGLLPQEALAAIGIARDAGVRIVGIHSYFGTNLMRADTLLEGLDRLGHAATAFPDIRYIDAGGGFGVPKELDEPEFDIGLYGDRAGAIVERHERRLGRTLELYLEPGRYLVADSGFYFAKAVDCKIRPDRAFVGCNGSVASLPRPLFHPDHAHHPCRIVGAGSDRPNHGNPVYVCGSSTYSQDFLARGIQLPLPEEGETLIFHHAGAYGRSMITNFLGKEHPEELIVNGVQAEVQLAR
jgi:diaminopimelate decarboxylase